MMRQKGQSQPDLPTFPLPNQHLGNDGNALEASGQVDNNDKRSSEKKGVVDPVKASPVPAATKPPGAGAVDDPQLSTRYEQLNNSTSSSGRNGHVKGQSPKTVQQIQNMNKNQGNTGITMGPGAAAPLGIPGITQPYQLLKYSAISRCGMVLKQVLTSSGDGSSK